MREIKNGLLIIIILFFITDCSGSSKSKDASSEVDSMLDLNEDDNIQPDDSSLDTEQQFKGWLSLFSQQGSPRRPLLGSAITGGNRFLFIGGYIQQRNGVSIITKLDYSGEIVWTKKIEEINGIQAIDSNRSYVVITGYKYGERGDKEIPVIILDHEGNIVTSILMSSSGDDEAYNIKIDDDNSIYVVGYSSAGSYGRMDGIVFKLDVEGRVVWNKIMGTSNSDYNISATIDGEDIIVLGVSETQNIGDWNLLLTSINKHNGSLNWSKSIGGVGCDYGIYIDKVENNGGYILSGYTESFGATGSDIWIVRVSKEGEILWQKRLSIGNDDKSLGVTVLGFEIFVTGYITTTQGKKDLYLLRLSLNGEIISQYTIGKGGDEEGYNVKGIDKTFLSFTGYSTSEGDDIRMLVGFVLPQKLSDECNWISNIRLDVSETNGTLSELNIRYNDPSLISPLSLHATTSPYNITGITECNF